MVNTLAGWATGLRKLAEADMATVISRACGEMPRSPAVLKAMGANSTATAGVGITWAARAVRMNKPAMTARGPSPPTMATMPSARNSAAPVFCMAMPRGSIPAMRNTAFHSIKR